MNKIPPATPEASTVATLEATLPAHLVDQITGNVRDARAPATRRAYAKAWAAFAAWCEAHGRSALPATPQTVGAYLAHRAAPADDEPFVPTGKLRKPAAPATLALILAAVSTAHRLAGHPLDTRHPLIRENLRGIRANSAHTSRQARPLLADELALILETLGGDPKAVRDAALLVIGWAGALRRSELVGLDWQTRGTGRGAIAITDVAVEIELHRSKASQTDAVRVIIPKADMPDAAPVLDRWAAVANLVPGAPVFRGVDRHGHILPGRLNDSNVVRAIKQRCRQAARARGLSEAAADEMANAFSGHSLRAGYATSAAAVERPGYRIQQHMRHRSADMTARYIRAADQLHNSGLKGVWRGGAFSARRTQALQVTEDTNDDGNDG